jgi:hypothetical protein
MTTDLLAIAGLAEHDEALVDEVARRGPASTVTVVIDRDDPEWALDESPRGRALRDRLARLLALIEQRTGAAVSGLVGDLRPLRGRWFDAIVDPGLAGAAF